MTELQSKIEGLKEECKVTSGQRDKLKRHLEERTQVLNKIQAALDKTASRETEKGVELVAIQEKLERTTKALPLAEEEGKVTSEQRDELQRLLDKAASCERKKGGRAGGDPQEI